MQQLLVSDNSELLKFAVTLKKEALKRQYENIEFVTFDHLDATYLNVEEEMLTLSLFSNEKCIIIHDAQFFISGPGLLDESQKVLENLLKNHPVHYIITATGKKLDERRKISQLVKETSEVTSLKDDFKIRKMLFESALKQEKFVLTADQIEQTLFITNGNLFSALSEVQRMSKQLNTKNLSTLALEFNTHAEDDNLFALSDLITSGDIHSLLHILEVQHLRNPYETNKISGYLFNHTKLLYEVQYLKREGYKPSDIASLLKVHEYRIKLMFSKVEQLDTKLLETLLIAFIRSDYDQKTGVMDKLLSLKYWYKIYNI